VVRDSVEAHATAPEIGNVEAQGRGELALDAQIGLIGVRISQIGACENNIHGSGGGVKR